MTGQRAVSLHRGCVLVLHYFLSRSLAPRNALFFYTNFTQGHWHPITLEKSARQGAFLPVNKNTQTKT